MKQEVKVSFYLKRNETKKDGKSPVMVRLSIGKFSETIFSAKMTVPADLWASGRATGKSHTAIEINLKLDEIRASALSYYRELSAVRDGVTAEDVKNLLLGMASGQETLLSYFRTHNENFDKRIGVNRKKGSEKGYWQAFNHLTNFLKEKYRLSDIPFAALDRSFIDKFDLYLKIDRRLALGTIVLLTTRLGTIISDAIAEGIITKNPFIGYEAERPERQQKYLTRKELNKLITTPLATPKQYLIRDLFLFSCYTGIPYCDMCKLTEEDVSVADDDVVWIKTFREKTGIEYEIPLLEIPFQILERYRGTTSNGRLLPMYLNSELNRELKNIARICGISRRLTWHCGRHTYATEITLSQGVPIETVSRMLGHNQIKTTQIYAKITNDKIDEDMKALEKRLAGKFKFAI
ncbi:site-specific integrase [Dysgonomonas sp. 521]|uniref:site-specific integrase n=1 Tax=Bacteroidales TaxID=171549 RepID=UPI0013D3E385|nr:MULTISPECIES: site-specific integrase [Bacteroidales]NDV95744.1 site-specific integrase [Dysgonomonas sp. 521]